MTTPYRKRMVLLIKDLLQRSSLQLPARRTEERISTTKTSWKAVDLVKMYLLTD